MAKQNQSVQELDLEALPRHVAVIMDGNGRWAKKRMMPRVAGHAAAMKRVKMIMTKSSELGIGYLTLYAFSTENWKRPKDEVSFLMNLVIEYMKKELQAMDDLNIRVSTLGDLSGLPDTVHEVLENAKKATADNQGLQVNLALNYGSRIEIVKAARSIAKLAVEGKIFTEDITEELFAEHLETAGQPDPDLLIRTSGEERLSNFLLYQLAYSELYFTPIYWPDFDEDEYVKALLAYQNRERRYGDVKA